MWKIEKKINPEIRTETINIGTLHANICSHKYRYINKCVCDMIICLSKKKFLADDDVYLDKLQTKGFNHILYM
jgi:hypothetical protein